MMKPFLNCWALSLRSTTLVAEANKVARLRILGMIGAWPVAGSETHRMWTEKPGAFVMSAGRATEAVLRGGSPDQVYEAALIPIDRKTRANARRLSKRRAR